MADSILAERLQSMGAVVVEGAKWCGKTTTCERVARFWDAIRHRVDHEDCCDNGLPFANWLILHFLTLWQSVKKCRGVLTGVIEICYNSVPWKAV